MTERRNYGITLFMIFLFLAWSSAAFADFSGKGVAVKDGDTLEVMKEGAAVRVRLYGIDCPEKGQAFGQRAKQFASDLACEDYFGSNRFSWIGSERIFFVLLVGFVVQSFSWKLFGQK